MTNYCRGSSENLEVTELEGQCYHGNDLYKVVCNKCGAEKETLAKLPSSVIIQCKERQMIDLTYNLENFTSWGKTPRAGSKGETIVVMEKMDGSNCGIHIKDDTIVGIQSRNRSISPNADGNQNDNFGFARWVHENQEELLKLGDGSHYGEWCGEGIQKNPHKLVGKHWFLFSNPFRPVETLPECVSKVPVLYVGDDSDEIMRIFVKLYTDSKEQGYKAEGIIVYYPKQKRREKITFEMMKGKWNPEVGQYIGHEDRDGQPLFVGDRVYHGGAGRYRHTQGFYYVCGATPKMIKLKKDMSDEHHVTLNLDLVVKVFNQ